MKIKFSKTLAIACALCLAFATLTAFADVTVTTITNYDFDAAGTEDMTITTTVAGLTQDGEITYYVENAGEIVFIDQKTAEDNEVEFVFKAAKNSVISATAKNGSDKGYAFPTFKFNEGCNYLTQGTATLTQSQDNWGVYDEAKGGYVFQGQISGAVEEYGITITVNGNTENLLAKGCSEDGTFAIVVQNIDATEAGTVVKYVK